MRLADVPIHAKVSLAPAVILTVLIFLSVVSLHMLGAGESRLRAITEQAFPTYQRASETKDAVSVIQTALQHTLSVAANESDAARIRAVSAPVHQAMETASAALRRLLQRIGPGDPSAAVLQASFDAYRAAATEVLDTAESDPATASMLMTGVDEQFAKLSDDLDGYRSRANAESRSQSEQAMQAAGAEKILLLSAVGVAIGVCGGIMVATSRAIGRPVMRLTATMTAMAADDLDQAIPAVDRGDEIGAMARAVEVFRINGLAARRLAAEQDKARTEKAQRQVVMEQHTHEFGSSIAGVTESLGGSADGMRRAAAAMAEVAAQVFRRASATADGAGRASADLGSIAAAIEQLTGSVAEISRQVAGVAAVAGEAVRSAAAGGRAMDAMAETTSRIGDAVRVIGAISEQTNLLALNATIEAARAGQAGSGFAVVAHEVKALAARTTRATSDIESQIAAVRAAVDASRAATAEVGAIIGRMDQIAAAIAAAVEQQTAATRSLAANVQSVSGATDQAVHAMEAVAGAADNAGSVSREVLEAADAVGRQSETLRSEVDRFLSAVNG
jgi:methyl-accepting chemotaxis protein